MVETLIYLSVALLAVAIFRFVYYMSNLHGPWGIPVLGFYPFLRKDFHKQLTEMSKEYGDVYILPMAGKLYLILCSHRVLHEVFVLKSGAFLRRNVEFSALQYLLKDGLPYLNDEAWRVILKFMSKCMRELNLSPKQLDHKMSEPLNATINSLVKSNGEPVDLGAILSTHCIEIVRQTMLGDVSDDFVSAYNKAYERSMYIFASPSVLLCGNVARYLIMPFVKGYKDLLTATKEIRIMLREVINNHRINLDLDHPKDLIDYFLCEKMTKEKAKDPHAKYFSDEVLMSTIAQYFGDGGSTAAGYITNYLRELALKMEVQNAMYEEISRVIGTERLPTYEDRMALPLVMSVIKEIERMSLSLPIIPKHLENTSDTMISGVFVPKGTITLVNLHAIHNDPNVYMKPEQFIPERFMPQEKIPKPVTFGIGKRTCVGEPLVTAELFLFLVAIIQCFTIQLKEESTTETSFQPPLFIAIPRKTL